MHAAAQPPLLDAWSQGDFTLSPVEFPFLYEEAGQAVLGNELFAGAMVVSQTCDLMRPFAARPIVQVAAIVTLPADALERVAKGYSPQYLTIGPLKGQNFAVDLDRVACVEKRVVANWQRERGCETDDERRAVANAISRHKHRFAFPDAFQVALKPLRSWIEKRRSKKDTPAGQLIIKMRQMRFLASNWDDLGQDLKLFCIFGESLSAEQEVLWEAPMAVIRKFVQNTYPHAAVEFVGDTEISMRDYTDSDRFDEGLSTD